jgi:hypothetical protein
MKLVEQSKRVLRVPRLTLFRVVLALAIAIGADGLQLMTGALGWAGPDQAIDVVTMLLIGWLIGFHILLLPTFVLNLIPAIDDLPTWIACTIAVIFLRYRQQRQLPPPPPPVPPEKPTIEI